MAVVGVGEGKFGASWSLVALVVLVVGGGAFFRGPVPSDFEREPEALVLPLGGMMAVRLDAVTGEGSQPRMLMGLTRLGLVL